MQGNIQAESPGGIEIQGDCPKALHLRENGGSQYGESIKGLKK